MCPEFSFVYIQYLSIVYEIILDLTLEFEACLKDDNDEENTEGDSDLSLNNNFIIFILNEFDYNYTLIEHLTFHLTFHSIVK